MKIFSAKHWLVVVLATSVLTLVSCKKEVLEKPRSFDPGIDGVAVAPLPPIDESMAQISLDDLDAIPNYRSTGSLDEAASETIDRGETEMVDHEETDSEEAPDLFFDSDELDSDELDSDELDSDDANSF